MGALERDDVRAVARLTIRAARAMSQHSISIHQLDAARLKRTSQLAAAVEGTLILIYLAGDDVASTHEPALVLSDSLPGTPDELISDLSARIGELLNGARLDLDEDGDEVSIPERAMTFVETAAETLRASRRR